MKTIDLNVFGLDEVSRAFELFEHGHKISEVAQVLGITEIKAARFQKHWREYKKIMDELF